MNSSVTCDSATSVTSSWRRLIRLSSRSNGPSKLSRRTRKRRAGAVRTGAAVAGRFDGQLLDFHGVLGREVHDTLMRFVSGR